MNRLTILRQLSHLTMKTSKKVDKVIAEDILSSVDNFLFDCDGVLWHAGKPIPGCPDLVQNLQKMGKRVFYLTNNSSKTQVQLLAKCQKMGYPSTEKQIMGTAYALALYLKELGITKEKNAGKVYVVGNNSMAKEMDKLNIPHTGVGPDHIPDVDVDGTEAVQEYCMKWTPDPDVKCVAVGFDPHLSYVKMTKGATYASNRSIPFLATNEDNFLPTHGDVVVPGTGSVVAAVKTPARRQPDVIGKPSTHMFELIHNLHGIEADRTIMVGDSLNTDIAMAGNCGLRSLLVLTGADNLDMVAGFQKGEDEFSRIRVPDYYIDSLADLAQYMPSNIGQNSST